MQSCPSDHHHLLVGFALRANIVLDKQDIIQYVEEGGSAVEPNSALTMCTTLHKKGSK